ncbi:MAG: inositol monophosphatase family protein [Pyrinomonadaceae bacterium]
MKRNNLFQIDFESLLLLAKEAATKGALIHRNGLAKSISAQTKSSRLDLVCEVDIETEKVIVEHILNERPDDSIIGEEGYNRNGNSGVCWIIDPLDGTVNYLHRYPAFGISIGVEIDKIGAIGVVYDTFQERIYTGIIDNQAKCDGETIFVSNCSSLENALITTGFLPNREIRTLQGEILTDILPNVLDIRRSGSPIIDFCRVASGVIDGFYEFGLKKWDVSAGSVIAQASGAKVTTLAVNDKTIESLIVASAPEIHQQLLELVINSWEKHK